MGQDHAYNVKCGYYCERYSSAGVEFICGADMDMTFCSKSCAYATNNPQRSEVRKISEWEKNRFQ